MRRIKEVLRLKFDCGLSHRQIARALGMSLGAVSKYVSYCAAAGIDWASAAALDEAQLEARLFPPPVSSRLARVAPDWALIHSELKKKGVTLQLLWEYVPCIRCRISCWAQAHLPNYGVLMHTAGQGFILAIDGFAGREDVVIRSLDNFRPKGVAGVTTRSNGDIVLILDIKEPVAELGESRGVPRSALVSVTTREPAQVA